MRKAVACMIIIMTSLMSSRIAEAKLEKVDSTKTNIREYLDEPGYFQVANRDLGDPRFMFKDPKGIVDFGVGGKVGVAGYYGFGGQSEASKFRPGQVIIPSDYSPTFGARLNDTEVHVKARSYWKGHKMVGYIKVSASDQNVIQLDQAYISFDGLSVGKIPSFFMDLEVGPMTTGVGICTRVDRSRVLIGYKYRTPQHWTFGLSVEQPEYVVPKYSTFIPGNAGVSEDYQNFPDIAAQVKYRWEHGHIQLSGIVRELSYWSFLEKPMYVTDGMTLSQWAWGINLSGNLKPNKKLKLSYQFSGGYGVSRYLTYCDTYALDMGIDLNPYINGASNDIDDETDIYVKMRTIPVISGFLGAQYNFGEDFSASLACGCTKVFEQAGISTTDRTNYTIDATANFFWNLSDYAYLGIEYMYAFRHLYGANAENPYADGHANRLAIALAYLF